MKKRFVSAALAAVMALSMTACGSSNSAAETTAADTEAAESQAEETTAEEAKTTDGGTLIVGFDQDFPPMGFVGDDGEYTGFDLELAQEVAKRLGLEYKAQPIAWDSKDMVGGEIPALGADSADINAGMLLVHAVQDHIVAKCKQTDAF